MSTKTIKTIIQLRRDLESNYAKIKDTFIPHKGEVVLVDTASNGLRAKVGNGTSTFAELEFADADIRAQLSGIVVRGYYYNGVFYVDQSHTEIIAGYSYKVYIDIPSIKAYTYSEENEVYSEIGAVPGATSDTPGVMKLYNTLGSNVDGTMTQSSITTEIGKKFNVSTDNDETLIFTNN